LGEVLSFQGRMNDAAPIFERTLAAQRLLFGNKSRYVANTLDALARARIAQNRISDAHALTEEAVEISKALADDGYLSGFLQTSFAQILLREHQFNLAEKNLREALRLYAKSLPPDHQYVASAEYFLGEVLLATKRLTDAEAAFTTSMNRWKRTDSSAWRSARSASALGETLYKQGRTLEAEHYLAEACVTISKDSGADENTKLKARERIERFYTDRGERRKLEQLLLTTRATAPEKTAQSN
jgi:TolA-binding protein